MKHLEFATIAFAAALTLAACSSNPAPNSSISTSQVFGELPQPYWSGNIRANSTDRLAADSTRQTIGGTLRWTAGATPNLSNAMIDFSYSGSTRELSWAIFYGPCGNASLPVVTMSDFPELEMSSGGRTQVTAPISIDLPTTGAFHVEIFKVRTDDPLFSIACGNLKFNRG